MTRIARIPGGFVAILFCLTCLAASDDSIYGELDPFDYLTGRFNPYRQGNFVLLETLGIPCSGSHHILRREAAESLKKMYDDFRKDHPKSPFWVQSSTRNFDSQKAIWENKWNKGGKSPSDRKGITSRGKSILSYSSMPGTSRHHWGTDFDLNVLRNSYFEKGDGRDLYLWLREHAHKYGFCQPYDDSGRSGYLEEKWHWSYHPLSKRFLADWISQYAKNREFFTRKGLFSGSEILGALAPVYVTGIREECR